VVIRFRIDGKSRVYDEDKLMISTAVIIEEHIGGTVTDWQQGLLDGRADCYQALAWLVLAGGDPDVPVGGVDCPMMALAKPFLRLRMREIAKLTAVVEKAKAEGTAAAGDAGEAA
jgi:hypothetical protein